MAEIIKINENLIKFKGIQYFGAVNLVALIASLKIAAPDNYKLLMKLKHIREALRTEGAVIDEIMAEIRAKYITEIIGTKQLPKANTPEFFALDAEMKACLEEIEITLNYEKIKLSEITGIESLEQLDQLNGFLELDME